MGAVMAAVGHRIGDDDMMLGVNGRLDVVANDAAMIAAGCHGAGIRIGERYLLIGSRLQLPANRIEFPEPTAQRGQSLPQVLNARRRRAGLRIVGFFELGKIAGDALFDMGLPARKLALGVVLLVRVHGPKPRTVNGNHAPASQAKRAANGNKALACDLDRAAIVAAEVGNGLEVRHQLADQPHQLDIAACLTLELPARRQLMKVAIDVELEHRARRITGPASRCRLDTLKAELGKIEFANKGIDDANRVVTIHIVFETRWQKTRLVTVSSFNETSHMAPPKQCQIIPQSGVFTQPRVVCGLAGSGSVGRRADISQLANLGAER